MRVCGIEIPDGANCRVKNWPFGCDLESIARLIISNNGEKKTYYLTEVSSEIPEEGLLTEEFSVKLSPESNTEGVMAEITSGKFAGTLLFLKFKQAN